VKVRRWFRRYLMDDAARRIEKKSRVLGVDPRCDNPAIARLLEDYRQQGIHRRIKHFCRETFIKQTRFFQRHVLPRVSRQELSADESPHRPLGINMAGFVQGEYGVGEAGRAMWRAVESTGLPSALINIPHRTHRNGDSTFTKFSSRNPYSINLMTFSFDYARRYYRDMGRRYVAGRYNIGYWFWEQEHFPARWHSAFDYYDEIWVPTHFIRESLVKVSPIPVKMVSYPLYFKQAAPMDRAKLGADDRTFIFLFVFDFYSTTQRKNPEAVVVAFRKAFSPEDNALLIIKSINSAHHPAEKTRLEELAKGSRTLFLDAHLPGAEVSALFAAVDCYVSLHRSEGLGLGMAQAMYYGKPVIATGYSGNLDFMNEENSFLVDYGMSTMEETFGPYEKGSFWAEPSVDHAAELMRKAYRNRDESAGIGERAAVDIRRTLDPAKTRDEILARVRELSPECSQHPAFLDRVPA
jgi:glycosyltransferase involved in cell wall biosynthesis